MEQPTPPLPTARTKTQTCASKVYYANKPAANAMAMKERIRLRKSMFVYECRVCGGWHLTHIMPIRGMKANKYKKK